MGQELRSFDTTQIDEKFVRSLMRTIIRTPIDNGRDPVGIYSRKTLSSRPPKSIHSAPTTVISPPTILLTTASRNYYSSSQV